MDGEPGTFEIYAISDDRATLDLLAAIAARAHRRIRSFSSTGDLLCICAALPGACVILDLPDAPGKALDAVRTLQARRPDHFAIIVVIEPDDLPTAIRALKLGAFDCISSPILPRDVEEAMDSAFSWLGEE